MILLIHIFDFTTNQPFLTHVIYRNSELERAHLRIFKYFLTTPSSDA